MKISVITLLTPLTLLLSACTKVIPAYSDIDTREGPCVSGGPDRVAQTFYDLRIQNIHRGLPDRTLLASYRPWLSDRLYHLFINADQDPRKRALLQGDVFSSLAEGPDSAEVMDASTIPNSDARNIPLRVSMTGGSRQRTKWQDEVLMIRESACWVVDDVRYLATAPHISGGSLRQVLQTRNPASLQCSENSRYKDSASTSISEESR